MARALFLVGLMERSVLSFPRAVSYTGLSTMLTKQEIRLMEVSPVFAQHWTAPTLFQEDQTEKLDSGILESKPRSCSQLKRCTKVQSLKYVWQMPLTRIDVPPPPLMAPSFFGTLKNSRGLRKWASLAFHSPYEQMTLKRMEWLIWFTFLFLTA